MPNVAVHTLLAARALDAWRRDPRSAPFDARDPAAASAYFLATVVPDAGYYPRFDRLFSELAHVVRPGGLVRALAAAAETEAERAFAFGWATHVLADLAVHPLLNEASGEVLHGARARPVTSTEDVTMHMRLEYGLDVAVFARHPRLDGIPLPGAPAESLTALVARGFADAYGWAPPRPPLARALRTARTMARLGRLTNRVQAARWSRRPLHASVRAGTRLLAPPRPWLPGAWNASPAARAILAPLAPPAWLVDAVDALADGFAEEMARHAATSLREVPDADLVTGAREGDAPPEPRTVDALTALAARGGHRIAMARAVGPACPAGPHPAG